MNDARNENKLEGNEYIDSQKSKRKKQMESYRNEVKRKVEKMSKLCADLLEVIEEIEFVYNIEKGEENEGN